MAVENEKSAEYTIETAGGVGRLEPDRGGLVRYAYFKHTQAVAGDATSTVRLRKLPAGKLRILGAASAITFSAFGASRVLDVGYAAHTKADGTAVTLSANNLADDINVASAGSAVFTGKYTYLDSQDGVDILATVAGGTIPQGATLEGYIAYLIG